LLPLDAERTVEAQVGFAFLARAAVRPEIAARLLEGVRQLEGFLADQIRRAQAVDRTAAHLDPEREATALLAFVDGLAVHTLARRHSPEGAQAIFDAHLRHLFIAD